MVFVILCGSSAGSAHSATFPRPLTPILGAPALKYALEGLAGSVEELVFIYAQHLAQFNFEEQVVNLFKRTRCTFTCIPFATRGAVETALVGVQQLGLPPGTPLVFLNNDNVYSAELAALAAPSEPFLGYSDAPLEGAPLLCSVRLSPCGGAVEDVSELARVRGTDAGRPYGTGVYGFPSAELFLTWARHTLQHGPFPHNDIFMSSVFVNMLAAGLRVRAARVPILAPLSSPTAVLRFTSAARHKLRLCFDLDNTLVTPPTVPGDYTTVRPVAPNIALARWARAEGHTVIIHTARRMLTHGGNVGRVVADIARATLDTLQAFDIPYDELLFGKPIADVYIDDKALNPYLQSPVAMGLPVVGIEGAEPSLLLNTLPNNKYNSLRVEGGRLVKQGPRASLRGEVNFYETLAAAAPALFQRHFAAFFGSRAAAAPSGGGGGGGGDSDSGSDAALVLQEEGDGSGGRMEFTMELVRGVPLTTLARAGLLLPYHLQAVVEAVAQLHAAEPPGVPLELPLEELAASFRAKLPARLAHPTYAAFADAPLALAQLTAAQEAYLTSGRQRVARVIHGDCWFANILLTPSNELRFVDMRGLVGSRLTLNGDPTYDWAKLLQSVLGFDELVFALPPAPLEYRRGLARTYGALLRQRSVRVADVVAVCAGLVAGCLPFYESARVRQGLWAMSRSMLQPEAGSAMAQLLAALEEC